MAGWVTRKGLNVFSMMAGWFRNGGLAYKNEFNAFVMMVGWFSNGGLGYKEGIECLLSDGGLV